MRPSSHPCQLIVALPHIVVQIYTSLVEVCSRLGLNLIFGAVESLCAFYYGYNDISAN